MWKLHSYGDDVSFYHFDEYARKITSADIQSLDDIVRYLRDGVNEDTPDRDLYLARGFLVFLSLAFEDRSRFSFEKYDIITFPVNYFQQFCRAADIECAIVKGVAKSGSYEVGDDTIESTHYWNAFKVEGQWHLFDPGWCVEGMEGREKGGQFLLEFDGKKVMQEISQKEGQYITLFDDYMFCPNPELFLSSHFPDDPEWQLCKEPDLPITLKEFLALPRCVWKFYQFGLRVLSENTCKVRANSGRCTIQILVDESTTAFVSKLFLSKEDMVPDLTPDDWPLLVLIGRELNIFTFEVRCPVAGKYHLQLYVGQSSESKHDECCEFCIICDSPDPDCRKLPINPSHGFGYTKQAGESGLYKPSVTGPKIFAKRPIDQSSSDGKVDDQTASGDEKMPKVTFRIDEDAMKEEEYASFLYCKDMEGKSYPSRLDESTRTLDVTPPVLNDEIEYAISISKRPRNSKGNSSFIPMMFYIVTFEDSNKYGNVRQTALQIMHEQQKQRTLERKQKKKAKLTSQIEIIQTQLQELQAMIDVQRDTGTDDNSDTDGPTSVETSTDETTKQTSSQDVPGKSTHATEVDVAQVKLLDTPVLEKAVQTNLKKTEEHCNVATQTADGMLQDKQQERKVERCNVAIQTSERTTDSVSTQTAEESDQNSAGDVGGRLNSYPTDSEHTINKGSDHTNKNESKHTRKVPRTSGAKSSGVCVLV